MQEEYLMKQSIIQNKDINLMKDSISVLPGSLRKGKIQINSEIHCYIINENNNMKLLTKSCPLYKGIKENFQVKKIKKYKKFTIIETQKRNRNYKSKRKIKFNDFKGKKELLIFYNDLFKGEIETSNNPNFFMYFGNRLESIGLTHFIKSKNSPKIAIELVDRNNNNQVLLHRLGELSEIEGLNWYFKFGEFGVLILTEDRVLFFLRGINHKTARFEPKLKSVSHIFGLKEFSYSYHNSSKSIDDKFIVIIQKRNKRLKPTEKKIKGNSSNLFDDGLKSVSLSQQSKKGNDIVMEREVIKQAVEKFIIKIVDLRNIFMVKVRDTSLKKNISIVGEIFKVNLLTLANVGYLLILVLLKADGFYFEFYKIKPDGHFCEEKFVYKIFPNLPKKFMKQQNIFEKKKMNQNYFMKCFKGIFEFDTCHYIGQFGVVEDDSGKLPTSPMMIKIEFNPFEIFSLKSSTNLRNEEIKGLKNLNSARSVVEGVGPVFKYNKAQSYRDSEALSHLQEDISHTILKSKLSSLDANFHTSVLNESGMGTKAEKAKKMNLMRNRIHVNRSGGKRLVVGGSRHYKDNNRVKRIKISSQVLSKHEGDKDNNLSLEKIVEEFEMTKEEKTDGFEECSEAMKREKISTKPCCGCYLI